MYSILFSCLPFVLGTTDNVIEGLLIFTQKCRNYVLVKLVVASTHLVHTNENWLSYLKSMQLDVSFENEVRCYFREDPRCAMPQRKLTSRIKSYNYLCCSQIENVPFKCAFFQRWKCIVGIFPNLQKNFSFSDVFKIILRTLSFCWFV